MWQDDANEPLSPLSEVYMVVLIVLASPVVLFFVGVVIWIVTKRFGRKRKDPLREALFPREK